ncbi:MAG: UDP-N-acetylmuramyl-tripeptide synthetase [Patescibacteria group bacterium]
MEKVFRIAKKIIPVKIFKLFQPAYHYLLALLGAMMYHFPAQHTKVIAVTGTKGKSSVVELTNAILEEAGFKTAVLGTIRFKIGERSKPNLHKMTTPGRFFVQKFLRDAVTAKCDYAVVEMTSEAARQFRHKFIAFDALIFTNLSPEHIESHGSYEKYVEAKLSIGKALEKSSKKDRVLVVNGDEKESMRFLALDIPKKLSYGLKDAVPYGVDDGKMSFMLDGKKINTHLKGIFNIYNCLAAATFAKSQNISTDTIKNALEKVEIIKGRVEHVVLGPLDPARGKQDFEVVVDYAHTADSMEKFYQIFDGKKKICVFGATGGGRDTWKRKEMGRVADTYCDEIILTDDDAYDEDPEKIAKEIAEGITKKLPKIIVDRREAIAAALRAAAPGSVVLITGKGTDPFLMGPNGKKLPWSDVDVAKEELAKIKS